MKTGKIIQIIGPVVDVEFSGEQKLPLIYHALTIEDKNRTIVLEVVKHLEPTRVRAIALSSTDGLRRGTPVTDTGKMIEVPVGPDVLGNIFDVIGNSLTETSNQKPATRNQFAKRLPIPRDAPGLTEQ